MKILSNVFYQMYFLCPICQCETLVLNEDSSKKHGLCSSLYLKCMECEYKNDFFTTEKVGRSFEINQRMWILCNLLDNAIQVKENLMH